MNTHTCAFCAQEKKSASSDNGKRALKEGMYDSALRSIEESIAADPSDADMYYYAAIASLGGKKAYVQTRDVIDKALAYLNKAISKKSRGIYYYLMAYIKYDYFERKYLNTSPNYIALLGKVRSLGVSSSEISEMYSLLRVERPSKL